MNLITAFEQERDLPYKIPLSMGERDACCSGKVRRLKRVFEDMGLEARYRVCSFRWSRMNLPDAVKNLAHEDLSSHVYLELKIGSTWKVVDPTWDGGLHGVFVVNTWNGELDTEIAVPVEECFSIEESERIMKQSFDEKDIEKNGAFYRAFNKWLEIIRVS
jgi:hypothetical protein